jgi:hypothetical protein
MEADLHPDTRISPLVKLRGIGREAIMVVRKEKIQEKRFGLSQRIKEFRQQIIRLN